MIGQLVGGERLTTKRPHLVQFERHVRPDHHIGLDLLAQSAMVNSVDGALHDRRMHLQSGLDLARIDILAASEDQVAQPAGEEKLAALEAPIVSGLQPSTFQEGFVSGLGVLPVANHGERAAHADGTTLPLWKFGIVFVDDLERHRGHGHADAVGVRPKHLVAGVADHPAGLRRPVARREGVHQMREPFLGGPKELGGGG